MAEFVFYTYKILSSSQLPTNHEWEPSWVYNILELYQIQLNKIEPNFSNNIFSYLCSNIIMHTRKRRLLHHREILWLWSILLKNQAPFCSGKQANLLAILKFWFVIESPGELMGTQQSILEFLVQKV